MATPSLKDDKNEFEESRKKIIKCHKINITQSKKGKIKIGVTITHKNIKAISKFKNSYLYTSM